MKRYGMIALFGIFAATLVGLVGAEQPFSQVRTGSLLSQEPPPCNPDYDSTCRPS